MALPSKQPDPLRNCDEFLRKAEPYGFAEAAGEAVGGGALPAGKTPAPEFGAAEATGDGEVCGAAGAGELCGAPSDFISSRRNALLAVPL